MVRKVSGGNKIEIDPLMFDSKGIGVFSLKEKVQVKTQGLKWDFEE